MRNEEGGNSVCTVVLRGSTDSILDDLERAVDDGVNTYKVTFAEHLFQWAAACFPYINLVRLWFFLYFKMVPSVLFGFYAWMSISYSFFKFKQVNSKDFFYTSFCQAMCRDSRIVPGAAATEIELARRLKEFSFKETG